MSVKLFSEKKIERDIAKLQKQQEKLDKEKEKLIEKKEVEDKEKVKKKDSAAEKTPIYYEGYSNKELLEMIGACFTEIASRTNEEA